MSINESGEFVREVPITETEKTPEHIFADLHDSFGSQSLPPEGVEKPQDLFFWKNDQLEHCRELFQTISSLVTDNNLTEVTHPTTGELIVVSVFLDKIKRSIEFSDSVATDK